MPPRLLWVTDEVPDAGRGGGSIRQYQLLNRIAKHADVDLLFIGDLDGVDLPSGLRNVKSVGRDERDRLQVVQTARRRLINLAAFVPRRPPTEIALVRHVADAARPHLLDTSQYDVVQVEHEYMASVLPRHRRASWAITLHHLVSVRSRQRAAVAETLRHRTIFEADARRAQEWEERIASSYDLTIVVSPEDASCLKPPVAVIPNGVDLDKFSFEPLPDKPRMIFSGSFNYEPNIDGAAWLCKEILPLIRARVPEATVVLVGREPNEKVRRLATMPGVEAHFDVPDVAPLLKSARVALVPLRQGSGTRLKALEAMAAGRPVVGTSIGLEGLGVVNGSSSFVADHANEIADATARLLADDVEAAAIASRARRLAEDNFGWDHLADTYLERISALPRRNGTD